MIFDVEHALRAIAKVIGDRGHAVALFNRVARNRQVRPVESDQRDVGAVKRGHERQSAAARSFRQHLARQQSAHRMRDRIVDVKQVEIIQLRNFGHARGQRQVVGRVIEKRITRDLDLVIVNVWFRSTEPDGLGVGNEMNVVPALGQFQT